MNSGDSAMPAITQRAPLAVDQRRQRAPGFRPCACAKPSETSASQRAVGRVGAVGVERRGRCAALTRFMRGGCRAVDADQLADDRVGHAVDLDAHDLLDRGLHVGHAGRSRAACRPAHSGARLTLAKTSAKRPLRVEAVARQRQRVHRRQAGDEAADAAGHHQRDRQRLAPHAAAGRAAACGRALHRSPATAPTARSCARCARSAGCGRRRGRPRGRPCRRSPRCA